MALRTLKFGGIVNEPTRASPSYRWQQRADGTEELVQRFGGSGVPLATREGGIVNFARRPSSSLLRAAGVTGEYKIGGEYSAATRAKQFEGQQLGYLSRAGEQVGSLWDVYQRTLSEAEQPEERYVGRAATEVQEAAEGARGQVERALTRRGGLAGGGAWRGMLQDWALGLAAAKAGAMTQAHERGVQENLQSRMAAGQYGAGLVPLTLGMSGQYGQLAGEYGELATQPRGTSLAGLVAPRRTSTARGSLVRSSLAPTTNMVDAYQQRSAAYVPQTPAQTPRATTRTLYRGIAGYGTTRGSVAPASTSTARRALAPLLT